MSLKLKVWATVMVASLAGFNSGGQIPEKPVRIVVVGLVHTHVHGILGRKDQGDIEIVGIVEADRVLAQRYSDQYGFSMDLVEDDLDRMLEKTQPEAVTAFNRIYDHLEVMRASGPPREGHGGEVESLQVELPAVHLVPVHVQEVLG